MAINYRNLNEKTRAFMAQEVELDISRGSLYFSKRFTDTGRLEYPSLLLEAVKYHDDDWLAHELYVRKCFNIGETRHSRNGNIFPARHHTRLKKHWPRANLIAFT